MKKNIFLIAACAAVMLSFAGCQDDSSSKKPNMSIIDFNKSSTTENASPSSDARVSSEQEGSENKPEIIDIPETEPYAFDYKYDASRGGMVITDYYKESPKVRIPDKLEGEPVVYVDFSDVEKNITMLVLPYGVREFSLSNDIQKSLSYIYIPTTVKTLYDYDFSKCTSRLTDVIYGDKTYDYKNVSYLIDSLKFDETGLIIENNHLLDVARYLTEVTVPDGINFIDKYAFDGCSVLTEVNLPDSIAMIDEFAFRGCTSLKEITIPKNTSLICEGAFSDCTNLTKVKLPKSLDYIDLQAFDKSPNVNFEKYGEIKMEIEDGVLTDVSCLATEVIVPSGVTKIGDEAFMFCRDLETVILPEGLTEIGEGAFNYCSNLKTVVIPNTVTTIGKRAFNDCESLTDITLPSSMTEICADTFQDCINLSNVVIPNGITIIGASSFSGCTSLTEIVIPDSVEHIRTGVFDRCVNLKNVRYKDQTFDYSNINHLDGAINGR